MIKYSIDEIMSAFGALLTFINQGAKEDQSKRLVSATGSNFRIIVIPSNDPEYFELVRTTYHDRHRN